MRPAYCRWCSQRVDPDRCWCGLPIAGHPTAHHQPLPRGCTCHLDHQES